MIVFILFWLWFWQVKGWSNKISGTKFSILDCGVTKFQSRWKTNIYWSYFSRKSGSRLKIARNNSNTWVLHA
ncbi:hypothetical protein HanIR_Chr05g0211471 [Helianthus annuus]|nr:hypothetical protein HanIR_Chr05g0211471 [Helianthus annuus]